MGLFFRDDDQDSKDAQNYHNKGEQDSADGKFDAPWTSLESVLNSDKMEDNDNYSAGWRNAENQKK